MILTAFDTKFFKKENRDVPNFPFQLYIYYYKNGTEN